MEEIYVNVEYDKSDQPRPSDKTGPRSSERRFHGAVVLGLGLLSVFLLIVLIGLSVHYRGKVHGLAAQLSAVKANLTEHPQAGYEFSSLAEERDRLNVSLFEITKERDQLLSLSKQKKTCPAGWKMFSCSCYLLSSESAPWEKGREECRASGADLVVIDSPEEQKFLSDITPRPMWIGLNDREKEGTWKWVDESPLTLKYWKKKQPDNGNGDPQWGEEDCVHIRTEDDDNWNDLSCNASLHWICEKMP